MQYSTTGLPQPLTKTPAIATLAALCIAVLSIASAAILIKFSEQEVNPYATAFHRFWITTAILGLWNGGRWLWQRWHAPPYIGLTAPVASPAAPLTWRVWGQLTLVGSFLASDLMLWAWSLTQTSVANATLLANLTPVFSCLGGWLFLDKRFDRRFVAGMTIAIAAIGLIGWDDSHLALGKFAGDAAALVAAIAFSVYLSLLEQLQTRFQATTLLLGSSAIASVVSFPVSWWMGGNLFPTTLQGWLAVLSLAVICQILGQGMLVHSLNRLSAEFVALFLLLEPILAGVGAWILLGEQLSLLNLVAFAIAMLGIYLSMTSPSALQADKAPLYLGELTVELAPVTITVEPAAIEAVRS